MKLRRHAEPWGPGPLDISPFLQGPPKLVVLRFLGSRQKILARERYRNGLLPGPGAGCVPVWMPEHAATRRNHDVLAVLADQDRSQSWINACARHGEHGLDMLQRR